MPTRTTDRGTESALLDSQRRVLERIANGEPLHETLNTLVRLIEERAEGMYCAVLLADSSQRSLSFVAGPSIPEDYKTGIAPYLRIAPDMGSCGTAAFLREPVYTEDTRTDVLWEDFRDVALRNGLRAIWSAPIIADDNSVLGTFAMYYREPRLPSPEHIQLIDMAVQMARVAIEAKRSQDALRKSEDNLRLVIDTIPAMVWSVLPDGTVDFLNQRWMDYTGLSFEQYGEEPTYPIHPEDVARALDKWAASFSIGEPYEDEMRLRRADGAYRWFLIRTVPLRDERGDIVRWYGTSTDIEDRKQAEDTLRRNQAFFAAEAQRIGGLLKTASPSQSHEPLGGDEVPATEQGRGSGKAPHAEAGAGRPTADNRRIIAERQALESLTPNERSIIRLIAEGKSNMEVAELLHFSPRTVETYRARLMQKLQLDDLVALVKFAIRNGMTSVD